jgi:polar amino acid transport system substrate-binding protein
MTLSRTWFLSSIVALVGLLPVGNALAQGKDLKASLPLIPPLVESKDKGILIDLIKAMADEYKEGKITWEVYPFAKSIANVEQGRADFHMPLLRNPNIASDKLTFMQSSESIFKVIFALYTNESNKDINPKNVDKYTIETDMGHVSYFDFKVQGSTNMETSLQKVSSGKIDGWIFAMPESDLVLKRLGLKNIKRWEYRKFDSMIIMPKGERGKEVDKILSTLIAKLKANGKYQSIMGPILDQKFVE